MDSSESDESVYEASKNESKITQINLLLVGETGVGKSTFINSFANYLSFSNMSEASKQDPILSLIPAKFVLTNEEGEEQEVFVGCDDNEVFEVGAAATQYPRSYKFAFDHFIVCLIDTPGMGDPRGIEVDRENMENILQHIRGYKTIDAICVLLKPNNARLTVTFEFCIKQLLIHLDKSASKNIVYVFTNSRSTFYKPGDTGPALRKILNGVQEQHPDTPIKYDKENRFCFDNEAFRFLVAVKNKISFPIEVTKDFACSWSRSSDEAIRMMQYIIQLKPHKVKNTVNINEARRLISLLSKPLADISENVVKNIAVLKNQKLRIAQCSSDVELLKDNLYIPCITLEFQYFSQPRTVCAGDRCRKVYKIDGLAVTHYPQRCHNPCNLDGIVSLFCFSKRN